MEMTENSKDEKCLFCNIQNTDTEILYEDELYLAFKDIKPASKHHYLIIPKRHMRNISSLGASDLPLLRKLLEIGKMVLEKNAASVSDARFGFHVPPFTTISHIHLHAISPVNEMGFLSRLMFRADSYWFITVSTLIKKLEEKSTQDVENTENVEQTNTGEDMEKQES